MGFECSVVAGDGLSEAIKYAREHASISVAELKKICEGDTKLLLTGIKQRIKRERIKRERIKRTDQGVRTLEIQSRL